jgi:predicted nucleic acid-binding protein
MNGKEFVDTNILIYAFDRSAGEKRDLAAALLERLWSERSGCLSLQVLQEFYVTATRKLRMPPGDAARQVERLGKWTVHRASFEDVISAIDLHRRKQVAFWDAMILRSAMKLSCQVLWSEDLGSGQRWDSVVVRDPFLCSEPTSDH